MRTTIRSITPLLLSLVCFGAFAGFLFHVTNNLSYAILSHAVLNGVALIKLMMVTTDDLETAPYYLQEPWTLVPALAVLLLLMRRIKKEAASQRPPAKSLDDSDGE